MLFLYNTLLFLGLSGPTFLLFYAVLAIGSWFLIKHLTQIVPNKSMDHRAIKLDKYDVAYLQGGVIEVLKLASLALIQKGYVRFRVSKSKTSSKFAKQNAVENGGVLSPLEANVLELVKTSNTEVKEFIFSRSVSDKVNEMLEPRIAELDKAGFLWSEKQLIYLQRLKWGIVIAVLLIGISKITYALMTGHQNIFFLMIEMGVFVVFSDRVEYEKTSSPAKSFVKEWQKEKGEKLKASYKTNDIEDNLNLVAYYGLGVLSVGLWIDYYDHFDMITRSSSIGFGCSAGPVVGNSSGWTWNGWGDGSGSSSCSGSSCGSSCGSGCGGGCGGCS